MLKLNTRIMGWTLNEYFTFTDVCLCTESLDTGLLHIKADGVWMCASVFSWHFM
jgi:hypothetical protein